MNWYPPFLGAGIRIKERSPDFRSFLVEMPLLFRNRNYVGVQFGGSLYSMCDPFFMLILLENLGPEYIVWDKSARIEFLKTGTGTVRARFEIGEERLADIRKTVQEKRKTEEFFTAEVLDEKNEVIARVEKTIYIRRRGRLKFQS